VPTEQDLAPAHAPDAPSRAVSRERLALTVLALAIASFVVPVVLALIALALVPEARRRIDASRGRLAGRGLVDLGRRLAILNLAVWGIGLVVIAALVVSGDDTEDAAQAPLLTIPAAAIEVGDCFDDQVAYDIAAIPVVPCNEPHDNEVYDLYQIERRESASYPGINGVAALAQEGCLIAFQDYVGMEYQRSVLEIFPIPPSEESWEESGDREVVCAVYEPGEKLTAPARGSGR